MKIYSQFKILINAFSLPRNLPRNRNYTAVTIISIIIIIVSFSNFVNVLNNPICFLFNVTFTQELEKLVSMKLKIRAKETMKVAEKLYMQGQVIRKMGQINIRTTLDILYSSSVVYCYHCYQFYFCFYQCCLLWDCIIVGYIKNAEMFLLCLFLQHTFPIRLVSSGSL